MVVSRSKCTDTGLAAREREVGDGVTSFTLYA